VLGFLFRTSSLSHRCISSAKNTLCVTLRAPAFIFSLNAEARRVTQSNAEIIICKTDS